MALAMFFNPDINKIFGSGPTHVAINNFAERLYQRGAAVVERCNAGKKDGEPRVRRPLVVRGHKLKHEVIAFKNILKSAVADNSAAPETHWSPPSHWVYALSAANWLSVLLGSKAAKDSRSEPAVKELSPDDSASIEELRDELSGSPDYARVRELARGEISWLDYSQGMMLADSDIEALLGKIITRADVLLTTPAAVTAPGFYADVWAKAKAVAIDEAGCMSRADLCSAWGNILRVLVLAGDTLQLRPTAMEPLNRFKGDLKISALASMQASGIPVYRLRTQLRMCTDMFGLAKALVYKDLEKFKYGAHSDPSEPIHSVGRAFEDWLLNVRKFPGLKPSADGTLEPVWYVFRPRCLFYAVCTDMYSGCTPRAPGSCKSARRG
jgi:hypothetical protein